MKYGYARPASPSFAAAGTGASIASDVRLTNGQPGEQTVIAWLSEASPTTADYVDLQMSWPAETMIGTACLLGLSCGAGVPIEVSGRRPEDAGYTYDLGGTSTTAITGTIPGGRVDHVTVFEPIGLIGLRWRIPNDRDGETWATALTDFLIGEAVAMSTVEIVGEAGWGRGRKDSSEHFDLTSGGEHTWSKASWRLPEVTLAPAPALEVQGGGLGNNQDWAVIEALTIGNSRALLIVDPTSAASQLQTTFFGRPSWDPIAQRTDASQLYGSKVRIREVV